MPADDENDLDIGQPIIYFDLDHQRNAGWIASHVGPSRHSDRPICHLLVILPTGRFGNRKNVEPAYHDGEKWILLNKWALKGEIPQDEWDY